MAKITIEIEDTPDGKVKVRSTPNFETMCAMDMSGNTLTAAHGYAFLALNAIRHVSKSNEPQNKILIPKIGRA